ncbi:hypothetical protein SAMN05216588_114149 [Pseudomonas flavescens]|uniref:Lipoprotein n=1 Tax=Phytopseudomonas flavescens TaxID=29435 RepID=A0A1G8JIE2_9GAMM|nr:hypothetical protein [Pseudomonas flavescens]SDI30787.1 hypothetical protein SAMN05216588_114149 [Pseudomonas flavescens]
MVRISVVGLALSLLAGCGDPDFDCTRTKAYDAAVKIAEKRGEVAKSARFPGAADDGVRITLLEGCLYEVSSYLETQDASGASIRRPFYVKVLGVRADREWLLQAFVLD